MPPEPLFVNAPVLRGHGIELGAAIDEFPDPPAPFSAPGADAISVKIAGLLPQIEGLILTGLPQVKAEARATADGIVAAADTYQRKDEELADMIRGTELGSGPDAPAAGTPGAANAVAAPLVSASSLPSQRASGVPATTGGADQVSQLASVPMQVAGQAAQVPGQVMGMAAAVPQTMAQTAQQVAQLAGGVRDDSDTGGSADEPTDEPRDEAAAEEPGGERAPVEEGLGGEPTEVDRVTEL